MMRDYYIALKKRVVTQTSDSGGSYTESTNDTDISGYIIQYTSEEIINNQQIGLTATAKLFTDDVLTEPNRVMDGSIEYEVVGIPKNQFVTYYDLKKIK